MPGDLLWALDGNALEINYISVEDRDVKVYNIEVEQAHTYYVSKEHILVHNKPRANIPGKGKVSKVSDILKTKKGSIKDAPLPKGSPSWNEVSKMSLKQIKNGAKANEPGYKTIQKLLTDKRFNK